MAYLGKTTQRVNKTRGAKAASTRVKTAMAARYAPKKTKTDGNSSVMRTMDRKKRNASKSSSTGTNRSIGNPKPGTRGANSYG